MKLSLDVDYSDETHSIVNFGLLSSFEFYLGNVTACLPLLSPAISRVHASLRNGLLSTRRSTRRLLSKGSLNRVYPGPPKFFNRSESSDGRGLQQAHKGWYPLGENTAIKRKTSTTLPKAKNHAESARNVDPEAVGIVTDIHVDAERADDRV